MHFDLIIKTLSRQQELTPTKLFVMILCEHSERQMTFLANELDISTAGMTGAIGAMEKEELVLRTHDDEVDRRAVYVSLTTKGRNYLQELRGRIEA